MHAPPSGKKTSPLLPGRVSAPGHVWAWFPPAQGVLLSGLRCYTTCPLPSFHISSLTTSINSHASLPVIYSLPAPTTPPHDAELKPSQPASESQARQTRLPSLFSQQRALPTLTGTLSANGHSFPEDRQEAPLWPAPNLPFSMCTQHQGCGGTGLTRLAGSGLPARSLAWRCQLLGGAAPLLAH